MNSYKDMQYASRMRDARREHRRSRGVRGLDMLRAKARALKPTSKHSGGHMPPALPAIARVGLMLRDGVTTDVPRGRVYPAVREAVQWVSSSKKANRKAERELAAISHAGAT